MTSFESDPGNSTPFGTAPVNDAYLCWIDPHTTLLRDIFKAADMGGKKVDETTLHDFYMALMRYRENVMMRDMLTSSATPFNPILTEERAYNFNTIKRPKDNIMKSIDAYVICYKDEENKDIWVMPTKDRMSPYDEYLTDYADVEKWIGENMAPSDRNFLIAKVKYVKSVKVVDA